MPIVVPDRDAWFVRPDSFPRPDWRAIGGWMRAWTGKADEHEAWTQRIDERQPVPDESRATLKTCYRDQCVEIWELYNDLEKNARIGDVLHVMQAAAWKPGAPDRSEIERSIKDLK